MPLRAVGGKADRLECQLCPSGIDKGSQLMVLSLPSGLGGITCTAPCLVLGSEPASAKDEHTTRFSLAFQCERTRRDVMMFALGWFGE